MSLSSCGINTVESWNCFKLHGDAFRDTHWGTRVYIYNHLGIKTKLGFSVWQVWFLGQTAETLTELPQLLGSSVVSRLRLDVQQRRAVGEVVAAEMLDALLQGTVERGLSSGFSIHKEEEADGCLAQPPPKSGITTDLCIYDSLIDKKK